MEKHQFRLRGKVDDVPDGFFDKFVWAHSKRQAKLLVVKQVCTAIGRASVFLRYSSVEDITEKERRKRSSRREFLNRAVATAIAAHESVVRAAVGAQQQLFNIARRRH